MKQRELDSMTAAELLGLWSARREGAYEDPMPEGISVASYGPSDPHHGIDDEAYIALWVDQVLEVQKYRDALVIVLGGGLMPEQALQRDCLMRQTSQRKLRTWQTWAKRWGFERGGPLSVGHRVILAALDGIEREKKTRKPQTPDRQTEQCEEDQHKTNTPDVKAKAEQKFPSLFSNRGDGYLVVAWGPDGMISCADARNYRQSHAKASAA